MPPAVIAQDTGGAIKGPVRGDLFWGTGDAAAAGAGAMNARGRYYLLLPRAVAAPLSAADVRHRSQAGSPARHGDGDYVGASPCWRQSRMPEPARVALLVTCLVDLFRPTVGFAAVKLLEEAGCTVEVPRAQTCCGQPAYNSGDRADAKAIARQVIDAFAGYDYVVAPSGSCAGMVKVHYPELFADEPAKLRAAQELAARTYELVSFLVDVRGMDAGRRRAGRAASPITTPARGCASSGSSSSRAHCSHRSTG